MPDIFVDTKIDDDVYEWAKEHSWVVDARPSQGYVIRRSRNKTFKLHRLVNGTPPGLHTDHINRDKLDNQRANLRTVSYASNAVNSKIQKNNTSGFKGVYRAGNKWRATIHSKGQSRSLGYFYTREEAARAFDTAALAIDPLYATNESLGLY